MFGPRDDVGLQILLVLLAFGVLLAKLEVSRWLALVAGLVCGPHALLRLGVPLGAGKQAIDFVYAFAAIALVTAAVIMIRYKNDRADERSFEERPVRGRPRR
jgi:hypothetical protein